MNVAGVRPVEDFKDPELFCETCKKRLVRAYGDRKVVGQSCMVEYDPVPQDRGEVILWFEIDSLGHPLGRQRYRLITAADLMGYTGKTWIFHSPHKKPRAVRG